MIKELLQNKTTIEKADIKSVEISKLSFVAKEKVGETDIEISSIRKIEGGIEVLAKAWKSGKQLGFGKDGTVDIERFRIFNPPILVPDGTTTPYTDEFGKQKEKDNFKEEPKQALLESLAHTISIVGKNGENIVKGKIGNTTSTFYPAAGANSPVDGMSGRFNQNETFAATIAGNGTYGTPTDNPSNSIGYVGGGSPSNGTYRPFFLFDTSAISDTDTVSAATLSIFDNGQSGTASDSLGVADRTFHVVQASLISDANVEAGDFQGNASYRTSYGTFDPGTLLATWATGTPAYHDFTFNATGIAAVSKTGLTRLGIKVGADFENTFAGTYPTNNWIAAAYYADEAGTTKDPKLVVVHAAAASGPSNMKTWDGLATASVKTMDGLAIASVKTWNGLA